MLLKELKCPGCGAPLKSKERDMMLACSHCGRISLFANGTLGDISYSIAAPAENRPEELIYVPFWIVNADLNVKKESIAGGKISRIITDRKQMRGTCDFYVCAAALPEEFCRKWNMDLTLGQPKLTFIPGFKGAKRAVMTMDMGVAGENAEFLFLRYETEIHGTLQTLEYDFKINSTKVLYLPAYKINDVYTLGISHE